MRRAPVLLLGLGLMLSGCAASGPVGTFFNRLFHGQPKPQAQVHYVLGAAYQAGGVWYYPSEQFAYDETGIASVLPDHHAPLTTDGEVFDQGVLAAAHQTLQLPALARVTNLENGRQVMVRINDRGPPAPSRLIAVTRRTAHLLGFDASGTARVRVELDGAGSHALAEQLHAPSAHLDIAVAPRGDVQATSLPAPGTTGPATTAAVAPVSGAPAAAGQVIPLRLPETVTQVAPRPGTLWIRASTFGRYEFALQQRARLAALGAEIVRSRVDGQERDTVRIGPIPTVAEADELLDRVVRAGVTDARVVVE